MKRTLAYAQEGRSGYVMYADDISLFSWYFEFGGGDVVVIINIPSAENWEKETDRPLADRQSILEFVAQQSVDDQVPGGHYLIRDQFIELYSGR